MQNEDNENLSDSHELISLHNVIKIYDKRVVDGLEMADNDNKMEEAVQQAEEMGHASKPY
ncbi:hypothetical protein [Bacillus taeanensis]|uniref:Uncharacterized protein n=1 Tax=Bacillus taeanensis TaxID=273032 RepID=A0A366XQ93_9BACI|nr:hypothetical protein [Bacillus taeanensis]RBW67688.1 hypothetical protein DS031_20665 [Bacillus taeanensis]